MRSKTRLFPELTCLAMGDPVVAHSDGWCVPADSDAGGCGVKNFQVCGSVRDCGQYTIQQCEISEQTNDPKKKTKNFQLRTGLLFSAERQALLAATHSVDGNQVLGVGRQARQGEVAPGWRQPLVLSPAAADHLVADPVAADFALGWEPVDSDGGGEDLGEAQGDW